MSISHVWKLYASILFLLTFFLSPITLLAQDHELEKEWVIEASSTGYAGEYWTLPGREVAYTESKSRIERIRLIYRGVNQDNATFVVITETLHQDGIKYDHSLIEVEVGPDTPPFKEYVPVDDGESTVLINLSVRVLEVESSVGGTLGRARLSLEVDVVEMGLN